MTVTVVILPGPDAGMGELLEELRAAAGDQARTAVTTGSGGVRVPDEIALAWLAARLGYKLPAPTGRSPATRPPAPTGSGSPAANRPPRGGQTGGRGRRTGQDTTTSSRGTGKGGKG